MNMETMKQFGNTWEERKEQMYKNLERKANIVKGISVLSEELTIDDTPERVKNLLMEWCNDTFNQFDEKSQEQGRRLIDITSELVSLRKKYNFYDSQMTEEETITLMMEKKYPKKLEEMAEVEKNMEALFEQEKIIRNENPDAVFLEAIHNMRENLIKKNELVQNTKKNDGAPYRKPSTIDVRYDAFDVFVISDGEKDPAFVNEPTKRGFHVAFSPISYIRAGDYEEKIIQHERIHNFIDPIKEHYTGNEPARVLKDSFHRWQRLKDLKAPPVILENEQKLFFNGVKIAVDNLQEELLAHLEIAEENSRPTSDHRRKIISEKEEKKIKQAERLLKLIFNDVSVGNIEFEYAIKFYATAGKKVENIVNLLNKLKKEYPEEGDLLFKTYLTITNNFTKFFNEAREILAVTREMGEEPYREAHALFFLIKPSDVERIKDFFKQKYSSKAWNISLQAAKKKGSL